MAGRIRTIKPEWLEDEKLAAASDAARLLSVALLLTADDYGNGRAGLSHVASAVWGGAISRAVDENAGDARELFRKAAGALQELADLRYLVLYECRGQAYFSIRNWSKHQNVRRPGKPRVPGPEEADETPSDPTPPPPDSPPDDTLSGKSPASRGTDLRPVPVPVPRPPTGSRAGATTADPPTPGAAAVVSLDDRRAPADLGEAHSQALRVLERALSDHGLVTPLPPGEYPAVREAATWTWQRVDGSGEGWRRAFTAIVERWAASAWVQRHRPQRPGGNLRSQLARLWDEVHGTTPVVPDEPEEPMPQVLSWNQEDAIRAEAESRCFDAIVERRGLRAAEGMRPSEAGVWLGRQLTDEERAAVKRAGTEAVTRAQAERAALIADWKRQHRRGS